MRRGVSGRICHDLCMHMLEALVLLLIVTAVPLLLYGLWIGLAG